MCNGIEFVNRIDDILSENKISRKDFCESININTSTMATWKTRNVLPPVETIAKIAEKLNVSMEWLLTGSSYQVSDFERGKLSRKTIRDRIYKTLKSKQNIEGNADNEIAHMTFFTNLPEIKYSTLVNWEKGYINLDSYIFEEIAYSLGVPLEYLLTGNVYNNSNPLTFDNNADQNIYDTAVRNLNDLFCLDNLTDERRKLAKDMLNQLMKLEHLEYIEKNKKDPQ